MDPSKTFTPGSSSHDVQGKQGYSHLTNDEMKLIMKSAVNRMDKLLWLKTHAPAKYQIPVEFGAAYTTNWDEPEFDEKF
jgi:hypothetical protein